MTRHYINAPITIVQLHKILGLCNQKKTKVQKLKSILLLSCKIRKLEHISSNVHAFAYALNLHGFQIAACLITGISLKWICSHVEKILKVPAFTGSDGGSLYSLSNGSASSGSSSGGGGSGTSPPPQLSAASSNNPNTSSPYATLGTGSAYTPNSALISTVHHVQVSQFQEKK